MLAVTPVLERGCLAAALAAALLVPVAAAEPLRVCATIPDLADLARVIGGDEVSVTTFAKGAEDPHFVEARPSFVKALSEAHLLLWNGLDLEIGWLPALERGARNGAVLPGRPGNLEAAAAIAPLGVATAPVDRSMGDVHAGGNPHFLTDPLNGLAVATLLRDRLTALRPQSAPHFERRHADFRRALAVRLVGSDLAERYDAAKLATLHEHGRLLEFLRGRGEADRLAGWLGRMAPHAGVLAVSDHDLWPYFARRFGIVVIGFLEPKPGVPPTTKHLSSLVADMRQRQVGLILASPYYDARHADFVARRTGARVARMAHQSGSRRDADSYLDAIDHNVRQVAEAIEAGR